MKTETEVKTSQRLSAFSNMNALRGAQKRQKLCCEQINTVV